MNKEIITIPSKKIAAPVAQNRGKKLRVAAYCRVSTDEERQLGSFENQIEYFTRLICDNVKYEMVKIYNDEGISGTSTRSRKGFRAMIADCEAGKIDFIITKSISRFARNTQDSLNYTRKLKDMGIGIYFEKEGINTLESSGELLLTLFSCFAQEESRSISENTAWGIRSKFQQGIPHLNAEVILGYDKDGDGNLVVNAAQAAVVRRIFRMYLEGYPLNGIARQLNDEAVPGVRGEARWCGTTISRLLENEKYKGALLMQKTFTANYLTRRHIRNTGQLAQYYIEDDHPAIIPPLEWEATQEEIARRREFRERHGLRGISGAGNSPFYARFFCHRCEGKLQRIYRKGVSRPYWQCLACHRRVDDEALRAAFCEAFNRVVEGREACYPRWGELLRNGTALQRVRARQMWEITDRGPIPFEVPELTQAVLQEAWLEEDGGIAFLFLSGESASVRLP